MHGNASVVLKLHLLPLERRQCLAFVSLLIFLIYFFIFINLLWSSFIIFLWSNISSKCLFLFFCFLTTWSLLLRTCKYVLQSNVKLMVPWWKYTFQRVLVPSVGCLLLLLFFFGLLPKRLCWGPCFCTPIGSFLYSNCLIKFPNEEIVIFKEFWYRPSWNLLITIRKAWFNYHKSFLDMLLIVLRHIGVHLWCLLKTVNFTYAILYQSCDEYIYIYIYIMFIHYLVLIFNHYIGEVQALEKQNEQRWRERIHNYKNLEGYFNG